MQCAQNEFQPNISNLVASPSSIEEHDYIKLQLYLQQLPTPSVQGSPGLVPVPSVQEERGSWSPIEYF